MNILIAINDSYVEYIKTMLYSLHRTNPVALDVYLLYNNLSEQNIGGLNQFCSRKCGAILHPIRVVEEELNGLPLGNAHFSIEMYYRIFVQKYVPETLDRILWLDADIVLNDSIQEFYHLDFEGKLIAGCPDAGGHTEETRKRCSDQLKLPKTHIYFNSGVLLFNLRQIRETISLQEIMQTLLAYQDVLVFPDQDILNLLYTGRVKMVEYRFNYQILLDVRPSDVRQRGAVVLHFVGSVKPWHPNYVGKCESFYWDYALRRGQYVNWLKFIGHRVLGC